MTSVVHDGTNGMLKNDMSSNGRFWRFARPKGPRWMLRHSKSSSTGHVQTPLPLPSPSTRQSSSETTTTITKLRRPRSRSCDLQVRPPLWSSAFHVSQLRLRVTVISARRLASKEGYPYAIVSCAGRRERTNVIRKSSDPEWHCTFDMDLLNTQARPRRRKQRRLLNKGLIITVCQKDRFRSVFVGQIQIPFEQLFDGEETMDYDHAVNQPQWYSLQSQPRRSPYLPRRRRSSNQEDCSSPDTMGEIQVKIGLVLPGQPSNSRALKQLWHMFLAQHASAASNNSIWQSSSSLPRQLSSRDTLAYSQNPNSNFHQQQFASMDSMNNVVSMHPLEDGTKDKTVILRKRRFRRRRRGHIAQFHSDVVGVTFLEISHANDLPPERNLTRTGFDMDPFVVISYGTSNFRTSAVRHNLNPVWNEKLYFHVHHNEVDYRLKLTVYDKDRFSGNDLVAWHEIPIMDIIKQSQAHQKKRQSTDEIPDNAIDQEMDRHTVPLTMLHKDKWKDRHPTLTFRAKFMPYDEIRRMFWIALARTYDVDGSGTLSRLEVQSMLETIGSTLSETTIDSFWRQHGQDPKNENDELPIENLVSSLEAHMLAANDHPATAPTSHTRRPTDTNDSACFKDTQFSSILSDVEENDHGPEDDEESDDDFRQDEEEEEQGEEDEQDDDDDAEDNSSDDEDDEETDWLNENSCGDSPDDQELFCSSDEVDDVDADDELILNEAKDVQYNGLLPVSFDTMGLSMSPTDTLKTWPMRKPSTAKRKSATEEKVIRIAECPICHRPNLSRRAQMDIVTHVATCAANDWTTVDRFLMGNFLTEAYAQRRWFVKLVSKVGYGKYSLGTNNANIIIQDRRTGQLIEERMSVYIRLGMRLVYKGLRTGIQSKTAQRILTNMTVRQGRRFDAPSSVREIPAFIKFHNISMDEVLEPLGNFKSFNDFFYRKLKPGSRPCDSPNDPSVAVSPADCRMLAFQTVNDATRLWIKGIEFSLAKLLDDPIGSRNFECGSLAIFRLAPQDYHRFHAPVDGTITDIKVVSGQYYTVNPMAIRTTLDVFGDNARTVIYMDTDRFGKVAVVCIGAMLVGSIIMTVKVGQHVNRTDEMGYFAFGGSTLVVIWERDKILLDKDLTSNSEKTLETLVRVGNHLGHAPDTTL